MQSGAVNLCICNSASCPWNATLSSLVVLFWELAIRLTENDPQSHKWTLKNDFNVNPIVYNSIIQMYFETGPEPDIYVKNSEGQTQLSQFEFKSFDANNLC